MRQVLKYTTEIVGYDTGFIRFPNGTRCVISETKNISDLDDQRLYIACASRNGTVFIKAKIEKSSNAKYNFKKNVGITENSRNFLNSRVSLRHGWFHHKKPKKKGSYRHLGRAVTSGMHWYLLPFN
ncbi:hypothetical protein ILUMI_04502 [Ignelater luminosus]|uniref:Uncharacterized protein n=1 Tax=Ignelater luminosus TaxID=2038154 RepID=A0A8K0D9L2_IGNLU|nr:hypothetical protein ILUMI_04502 [Ignelater luminosus]